MLIIDSPNFENNSNSAFQTKDGEDKSHIENLYPQCFQQNPLFHEKQELYSILHNFKNETEWFDFFKLNFESKFRGKKNIITFYFYTLHLHITFYFYSL